MRKFRLELRKYGSLEGEIKVEDSFDAGFTALAYIDSIMYFVGNPDTVAFEDIDADSLRCYFNGIGELVSELSNIITANLDKVNSRREDLERLVKYLQTQNPNTDFEELIKDLKEKKNETKN